MTLAIRHAGNAGKDVERFRILVVDDDRRLAASMQNLMELHGHQSDAVFDGEEAIERLKTGHYDVVLLDLLMPGTGGHEVLAYLQGSGLATLAIVISGETSMKDVTLALKRGAHDYLKKPYAPDELMTTVNNALTKKQLEDSHNHIQKRLSASEKLHRFLVDNSPDIIFILDEYGRFSFINHRAESLLQYERGDLLGREFILIVEQNDREKARYFLDNVHKMNDIQPCIHLQLRPRQESVKQRHFEVTLSRVDESAGLQRSSLHHRFEIYGTAREVTEQLEAEAFINFQAYHDILTRLPNRSLFRDRVEVAIMQAQRNRQKLAVMFIDLDRFKVINDSLGHTMGDRLLQVVSQRLQGCVRKADTLSRFGGDEFTLLLTDVADEEAALQVANKILDSIKDPFHVAGHEIYIGASIGIALYPDGGETLEHLVKHADIAMYRIKGNGKNNAMVFNPQMNGSVTRRHSLEQDLRKALPNCELDICYQPLVDTHTGRLHGVEALIRWNHPRYGRLSPDEFIPIAEDSRLIVDIDRETLRQACVHISELRKKWHPDLKLSVNLSPIMVERRDFVDDILQTLESTGFPASSLELEITERLLLSDHHECVDKLLALTTRGVTLAIDDFGTGFSSLSYLQKFPISTLKIDRSFVHQLHNRSDDACIVNAIVSMAQGLQMNIVAEGVEHETQLTYLRSLGCNIAQGFLFGAASSLEDLVIRYPSLTDTPDARRT